MHNVIIVPASLDDQSFERVLDQLAVLPSAARVALDARGVTWASPFGLTALLTLSQTRDEKLRLMPPENADITMYWARANFFRYAEELFELTAPVRWEGAVSNAPALLPLTHVSRSDDVHAVVERIQEKARVMLTQYLHLDSHAVLGFCMALSETCQHIVEHAGRGGWVSAQAFNSRKRMGGLVVQIAVCDAGIGIRAALEQSGMRPPTGRWDDAVALETAVLRATNRFPEHGRGQGFRGIRGYLNKWHGKLAVRSGTARLAIVPPWDDDLMLRENLAPMPGTQIYLNIPSRIANPP